MHVRFRAAYGPYLSHCYRQRHLSCSPDVGLINAEAVATLGRRLLLLPPDVHGGARRAQGAALPHHAAQRHHIRHHAGLLKIRAGFRVM